MHGPMNVKLTLKSQRFLRFPGSCFEFPADIGSNL